MDLLISNQKTLTRKDKVKRLIAHLAALPGYWLGYGCQLQTGPAGLQVLALAIFQPVYSPLAWTAGEAAEPEPTPGGVLPSRWNFNLSSSPARAIFSKVPVNELTPAIDDKIEFGSVVAKIPNEKAPDASTIKEETEGAIAFPIFEIPGRDIIAEVPGRRYPLSAQVIDSWFGSLPDGRDHQPNGRQHEQASPSGTSKGE